MISVRPLFWRGNKVAIDFGKDDEPLTIDEAQTLAYDLLKATHNLTGQNLIIACFSGGKGKVSAECVEMATTMIKDIVEQTGELDQVIVIPCVKTELFHG